MTLITNSKNRIDTRISDYDREAVELGLKIAKAKAEYEGLRKEIKFLSSFKNRTLKEVAYDESGELKRLDGKFAEYDQLLKYVEIVKKEINELETRRDLDKISVSVVSKEKEDLFKKVEGLRNNHQKLRVQISEGSKLLDEARIARERTRVEVIKDKEIAEKILKELKAWSKKEREDITSLQEENRQEKARLVLKAKDLEIYRRRVERQYEKMFPGRKMRFLTEEQEQNG